MRFVTGILILLLTTVCAAQQHSTTTSVVQNDHWDFISANRMLMWVSNNGAIAHNSLVGGPGLEWPKGSGHHLAYMQGLVWSGKADGQILAGGSSYRHGWLAGVIRHDGTPDDPAKEEHRIYRVQRFDPARWDTLSLDEQSRLLRDLREWPVQYGAPWVDANANGLYDPDPLAWIQGTTTDLPEFRGDEMLWFTMNDMDNRITRDLYGSIPAGLEMHTLLWASSGHPLLENVIFREHTLINKGINDLDSMSVGMWEDIDLGDPFDDFCGVDTALGLAYSYNGWFDDEQYGLPPATGTLWLQTPIVPMSGASARVGTETRENFANLPLSSFMHYIGGSSIYRDPQIGAHVGTEQLQRNMQGYDHARARFVDPVSSQPTPFLLAGDPVRGTGWVDGIVNSPGDRRYLSASSGFTLATTDTQRVLVASIAATGENQYLSVRKLRHAARQLSDIHRNLPFGAPAPVFTSGIAFPAADGSYAVTVTGGPFPAGTTGVQAVLRGASGMEIQRTEMLDDGNHHDGAAADGVFGATLGGAGQSSGADLYVLSTDASGTKEWFVDGELPLPGKAEARFTDLLSDTPNTDGRVQPGEQLRLRLRIDNSTITDFSGWHLFFREEPALLVDRNVQRYPVMIPAGGNLEPVYDANDESTYVTVGIPVDVAPGAYLVPVTLMNDNHCVWEHTISIDVDSLPTPPVHGLLAHVEGLASGSLGYTLTTPAALTEHDYRVSIEGEDFGEKTMHIEDVTLGTTLYRGWPLPDRYTPLSEEIDGWRINMGTAYAGLMYDDQGERLQSFVEEVSGRFEHPSRSWFYIPPGYLATTDQTGFGTSSTLYDLFPLRLVFDRGAGQKACGYLRGGVPPYRYTGYHEIPLRAYDMSDSTQPRQVMIAFVEQNGSASCDSSYTPPTDPSTREFLLVFADDYSLDPPAEFQKELPTHDGQLELLYRIFPLRDSTATDFQDGDAYVITPSVPVSKRDVYIMPRPRALDVRSTSTRPSVAALHPCHPNPVGGSSTVTTISFDTRSEGSVRLTLHDLLGRRIATIVDRQLTAGTHSVQFDAQGLQSGTYVLLLYSDGANVSRTVTVLR